MRRRLLSDWIDLALVVVIGVAAAFEAAIALQWIPVGAEPGENARFEGLVIGLALLALLAGFVISLLLATLDRRSVRTALFPVAASVLMIARYYTFDTYYLPDLTRYSQSGSFSPAWVYAVAIASVPAYFLSLAKPRLGFAIGAVVIFLCFFTVTLVGFGK